MMIRSDDDDDIIMVLLPANTENMSDTFQYLTLIFGVLVHSIPCGINPRLRIEC